MTPLRVMHVIGNLRLGGAEKLTATIIENLDRVQFEASVCCLEEEGYYGARLRERGFSVYALGRRKAFTLRGLAGTVQCILELRALFVRNHIDIVHTHVFGTGLVGRIAAKLAGVPIIVHTTHRLNLYGPTESWFERVLMTLTQAYVVDSNAIRQAIVSHYKIRASKVFVIYNGIDLEEFDDLPPRQVARSQLGLPQDEKVIAIIAHMTERKAHRVYVNAFSQILAGHLNACLLLVGDGPTRCSLEQLANDLGIASKVYFLGYREDLACVLAATDILAHPSEWEGFGIILAEAMYCRIPVITTNAGGGPEVVSHLETGILVPLGDVNAFAEATLTLLNDEVLAAKYGKAGRRRVEKHFLKRTMIEQYEQFYRQLASARIGRSLETGRADS